MRLIAFLFIFTNLNILFSQNIELFGGINNNLFYDRPNSGGHYQSSYEADLGFTTGLAIQVPKNHWLGLRFLLQYDRYGGQLEASDGGLGGRYETMATVRKSVISVGIFPINFYVKKINLGVGAILSKLLQETYSGTSSGWTMGQPTWNYNLQEQYDRYSAPISFGLQGRVAYDIKISKSIWLSPQYLYYLGLSNEFTEFPEHTKSMRHSFCIGLKRRLN